MKRLEGGEWPDLGDEQEQEEEEVMEIVESPSQDPHDRLDEMAGEEPVEQERARKRPRVELKA